MLISLKYLLVFASFKITKHYPCLLAHIVSFRLPRKHGYKYSCMNHLYLHRKQHSAGNREILGCTHQCLK